MYCESFHNKLKTYYFERKLNRRVDVLLETLLKAEKDIFLNHSYKLIIDAPVKDLNVLMCKKTHRKSQKIADSDIQMSTNPFFLHMPLNRK
jgi:hypothetical protein